MLDAVDHRHVERRFRRLQLQAELFLQRSKEGWRVRVGRWQRLALAFGPDTPFLREGHDELPVAAEARAIDDGAAGLADEHAGGPGHWEAVEGDLSDAAHDAARDDAVDPLRRARGQPAL